MKVAVLFHRDPLVMSPGIDLVRLQAISGGLLDRGVETEIVAPVPAEARLAGRIPVRPLSALDGPAGYDLVKTCYHQSIRLLGGFRGPVVSRLVRVVDQRLPERDELFRRELLACQDLVSRRARAVAFNNPENRERWIGRYGREQLIVLTPTGCPAEIPEPGPNPYRTGRPAILFLGSLAAPRMVELLNAAAERLAGRAEVHLLGRNKTALYGGQVELSPLIVQHGERPEAETWDFIRFAGLGLALATGPLAFDNDVSKIINYLRGGLPVLSEEPILQNRLVRRTGLGRVFRHGDVDDLVGQALALLERPPLERRGEVMALMAREHAWERRVETYLELFRRILAGA